jgi:ATP-dependent helicase/DNAse subunit B
LPLEDWETERVVRLFRSGQVRPAWPNSDRRALAIAASAINATSTFRGRAQLLSALERAAAEGARGKIQSESFARARELAARLFDLLGPAAESGPWAAQVSLLRQIARELGLGAGRPEPLETLWDLLDDHSLALDRLGRGGDPLGWSEFVLELNAIIGEISIAPPPSSAAAIRVTTVDRVAGASAEHVILCGLEEGSFPSREAIEPFLRLRPGEEPTEACRAAYAREMARFLRVVGIARSSLTLVYPTTDDKAQHLLKAGFLDRVLSLLPAEAQALCHNAHSRFHPALLDVAEMTGTANDLRVRAAALASERGDTRELCRLAQDPSHREQLAGTAAAVHALQRRRRGTPFSEYEGIIQDPRAIEKIRLKLGAEYCFSPSQIEAYISCPFQFFSKVVLGLKPEQETDELDEGPTSRGSFIHKVLEEFEKLAKTGTRGEGPDGVITTAIENALPQEPTEASALGAGIRIMAHSRARRIMQFYMAQRASYGGVGDSQAVPHHFETEFGFENSQYPALEFGGGDGALKLQGKIDRIDVLQGAEGQFFRVIDYKTGAVPSLAQVKRGEMLQVLLYAMAVENLILNGAEPAGAGYWALRKEGYKEISLENWQLLKEEIEAYTLRTVDRIRNGAFPVDSLKAGCESFCDYRSVCRIRQVRLAGKRRDDIEDAHFSIASRRGKAEQVESEGNS